MMKFKFLILCLAMGLSVSGWSQSVKEQKAYDSAVKKMTVKSVNKFLKKYPSSVLAEKMMNYRDSLLFYQIESGNDVLPYMDFLSTRPTLKYREMARVKIAEMSRSDVSAQEAEQIVRAYLNENALPFQQLAAAGIRALNRDYVYAVFHDAAQPEYFFYLKLENRAGKWEKLDMWKDFLHRKDYDLQNIRLHANTFETFIQDKKYFGFTFECVNPAQNDNLIRFREYCISLVDMETPTVYSSTFSGREIHTTEKLVSSYGDQLTASSDAAAKAIVLEGMNADLSSNTTFTVPPMQYLIGYMATVPFLKPVSEPDSFTDMAYARWYSDNEFLEAPAKQKVGIHFTLLDDKASIIDAFRKADKETSRLYEVAIVDFRGHTSLVARTKSKGQYILLWVEPQAQDKNVDLLLNSISFRYEDILTIYYFKGKHSFKKTIDLTKQTYY